MKKNILVVVGTGKFDELIKAVDKIAGKLKDNIIMQIGNGKYIPKNCKYFRYKPSLEKEYKDSWIVISHGGAGSIYELLKKNKKIIGVANINRTDTHQEEILKALSEDNFLIWCKDLNKVSNCIEKAKKYQFKKYKVPKCRIHEKITEFLKCVG
ncbi:glycosyltransferase [Candidatus Pacearchaeota archaeon]|nr:glycosyltransferase [Candidatus Pacearchaeota archaeon]